MSDSASDSTESGNGETDEGNSSDSSAFVESLQSGLGDGLLESLGGDENGGFEAIGRELGAQLGRLLGEAVGRQLDEQIQQMTENDDDDTSEDEGDEGDDENNENGDDEESEDFEDMSDEELQSTAEEISDELEDRSG